MFADSWFETLAWCKHAVKAVGPHGVHSPFVYRLITHDLRKRNLFPVQQQIEAYRKSLKQSTAVVEVNDLGAGSRVNKHACRSVASIAKSALQPVSHAQVMATLARHSQSRYILELGTSLGLTSAYLALSSSDVHVVTIEGAPAIAQLAAESWQTIGLNNIELVTASFDEALPGVLAKMKRVDFVLIDGNHRYEPTMRYVRDLLQFVHEETVIVLDDIHWSEEMERAWEKCAAIPEVTLSLDFFDFGVLYFKKGRRKEHFRLYRPWR
jgi:predicted O-methyltransferase YrrM